MGAGQGQLPAVVDAFRVKSAYEAEQIGYLAERVIFDIGGECGEEGLAPNGVLRQHFLGDTERAVQLVQTLNAEHYREPCLYLFDMWALDVARHIVSDLYYTGGGLAADQTAFRNRLTYAIEAGWHQHIDPAAHSLQHWMRDPTAALLKTARLGIGDLDRFPVDEQQRLLYLDHQIDRLMRVVDFAFENAVATYPAWIAA